VFESDLDRLARGSLLREVRDRSSPQGPRIVIKGREYLNFSSNDYLGLSNHPSVAAGAREALERYGAGPGAARLLAGGTELHGRLEGRLAALKGAASALLFSSGYAANLGALPALAREGDAILSDELNHASIIDGCRLSRARVGVYRHRDPGHLEELLREPAAGRKVVVTDTVFSMSGRVAPLREIAGLCERYGAALYLDDAHATGVLGGGRGALAHFGMEPGPLTVQMGTLSKALGSAGAFVAAGDPVIRWLTNAARSFMFSTALPPAQAGAALAALEAMEGDPSLLKALWENRDRLVRGLGGLGLDTGGSETPIVPVVLGDVREALGLSERLMGEGIYAPAIRPPTVREPMLRLTVTAAHRPGDVDALLSALARLA